MDILEKGESGVRERKEKNWWGREMAYIMEALVTMATASAAAVAASPPPPPPSFSSSSFLLILFLLPSSSSPSSSDNIDFS